MSAKPLFRLVKKEKRKDQTIQAKVEPAASPNRWSTAVETWVKEFQRHRRGKSPPALDSLSIDALLQEEGGRLGSGLARNGEFRRRKGKQATKNGARAPMEAYTSQCNERIGPSSDQVSQKRHLDVDAVLARSVRKVVSE